MKSARAEEKEERAAAAAAGGGGEGRKSPVVGGGDGGAIALVVSEVATNRAGEEVDLSDEELIAIARSWILRAFVSASDEGGEKGHYTKLLSDLRNPRLYEAANASALSIRLTSLAQTVSYLDENTHQALLMYLLRMSHRALRR